MVDAAIISETLDRVAEKAGDPSEQVYARLFQLNPDYEAMFVMDTDGGVRGSMLATSIDCLIGLAEGQDTPRLLLEASRMIHEGYGLADEELDNMFIAMRDTFRAILDNAWTPAMEAQWIDLLAKAAQIR